MARVRIFMKFWSVLPWLFTSLFAMSLDDGKKPESEGVLYDYFASLADASNPARTVELSKLLDDEMAKVYADGPECFVRLADSDEDYNASDYASDIEDGCEDESEDGGNFAAFMPAAVLRDVMDAMQATETTFTHPTPMEPSEYVDFIESMDQKSLQNMPSAMYQMMMEHIMFYEMLAENIPLFFVTPNGGKVIPRKITITLIYCHHLNRIIDENSHSMLIPKPEIINHVFNIAISMLKIVDKMQTPETVDLYKYFVAHLENLQVTRTVEAIDSTEAIWLHILNNIGAFAYTGVQFQLLFEMNMKMGMAFLRIVKNYIKVLPEEAENVPSDWFFYKYSDFLLKYEQNGKLLGVKEIMDIMNRANYQKFTDGLSGTFHDCPYLNKFLESQMKIFDFTNRLEQLYEYLDAMEKQRLDSIQGLIDEETEEALRKAASKPKAPKTKKGKNGKGKGGKAKEKKPIKKTKPVTKPARQISTTTTATTKPIVCSDPDRREVVFAKIVVGEYIMKTILKPALTYLGFDDASYTWDEVIEAISSNVNGRLSSRRLFLGKCIEWIKERSLVAHPDIFTEEDYGQLWFDLDAIQSQLKPTTDTYIRKFLKDNRIPRPKTQNPFSPFGRPELGITEAAIKKTFAAVRLSEFLMSRTVKGPCAKHHQKPSLPLLKGWRVYLPFLRTEGNLKDADMDAVVDLLQYRNNMAHPDFTPQMVRVLIESVLSQHPDYELFLSRLGKKD